MRDGRTNDGSDGIVGLRDDERDSHSHPVRKPPSPVLSWPDKVEVTDNDLNDRSSSHNTSKDSRAGRDRQVRKCHGFCDGAPGGDRGCAEGARLEVVWPDQARVRGHEDDEDARRQEHRDKGTDRLGVELEVWRCSEQETDSKVGD